MAYNTFNDSILSVQTNTNFATVNKNKKKSGEQILNNQLSQNYQIEEPSFYDDQDEDDDEYDEEELNDDTMREFATSLGNKRHL